MRLDPLVLATQDAEADAREVRRLAQADGIPAEEAEKAAARCRRAAASLTLAGGRLARVAKGSSR